MMNVLITGATGFIGGHTLRQLAAAGHTVVAIHRRDTVPDAVQGVAWVRTGFDKPDWNAIGAAFAGKPQVLVHLAAHGVDPTVSDWDDCFQWNVVYSMEFWRAAVMQGVQRIVTCGTCFEYGGACDRYEFVPPTVAPEPLGPYAASKAAATMSLHGLAAFHGIEGLVLRPGVVFGEGEGPHRLWPSLRKAALEGQDFLMTSGSQVRDFVPVEKVARAFVDGVSRSDLTAGRALIENVGSGEPRSVKEFASEWWDRWDASGELLFGTLPDRTGEASRIALQLPSRSGGRSS
jgi:nucleoside-diphosphate-sugar epimerase